MPEIHRSLFLHSVRQSEYIVIGILYLSLVHRNRLLVTPVIRIINVIRFLVLFFFHHIYESCTESNEQTFFKVT